MDATFDKMYYGEGDLIGGIDEAGVGDIAGPLTAACVILPKIDLNRDDLRIFEVNDSKKIPEKYRKQHAETIWQVALGIGIGEASPAEVDYFGNKGAIRVAIMRAIAACRTKNHKSIQPDFLLIDGTEAIPTPIKHQIIKHADTKSLCVAAASIIAKVYRDDIMIKLHAQHPHYGWIGNKGHPCEQQFKGLDEYGVQLGIHRMRRWPFTRSRKVGSGWESAEWRNRRYQWRQKTEKLQWSTERESSSHSIALKNLLLDQPKIS